MARRSGKMALAKLAIQPAFRHSLATSMIPTTRQACVRSHGEVRQAGT